MAKNIEHGAVKVLKKYPNRRIYDTEESRYITVNDVHRMVLDYVPFKVVDSKTGDDLTRATLLQVITELEAKGHESLLTNRVLEELIRFYGDSMNGLLRGYLEQAILAFLEQQARFREQVRRTWSGGGPLLSAFTRPFVDFWKNFTPLVPGAPGELREVEREKEKTVDGNKE